MDGFTTFGLKIWQPEVKTWVEISVLGNTYKCREEATIWPTKANILTTSHGNILTNGTVIDVGGISMMFQSPVAMSRFQNVSKTTTICHNIINHVLRSCIQLMS